MSANEQKTTPDPTTGLDAVVPLDKGDPTKSSQLLSLESEKLELAKETMAVDNMRVELERARTKLKALQQDTGVRLWYALGLFAVMVGWLSAVLWVLSLCAIGSFVLSDAVLITLLTTTTVNVLAMIGAVIAYLFHKTKKGRASKPDSDPD